MYFKNKEKEVRFQQQQLEFSHQLWFLQIALDCTELEDRRPRTIKYPRGTEASLLRPRPLLSYIIYHSRLFIKYYALRKSFIKKMRREKFKLHIVHEPYNYRHENVRCFCFCCYSNIQKQTHVFKRKFSIAMPHLILQSQE